MNTERLHYAKEAFEFDHERSYDIAINQGIGKPGGFWWSVGDSWAEWCRAESFREEALETRYQVVLRPDAKILDLMTVEDLLAFTKEYEIEVDGYFRVVDWSLVVNDGYQGIQIAPYQWELRLDRRTSWYYSWDCASGVAWDPKAVESLQLVVPEKA